MEQESVARLTKDLKQAATTMNAQEARYLVSLYYQMQDNRIRAAGQVRSMGEEPHQTLSFFEGQGEFLEGQIKRALDTYSVSNDVGAWSREVCGIGPVIAAGLMAHIDITKAPTAGHIWRFAGLDSTVRWANAVAVKAWIKETHTGPIDEAFVRVCANYWGRQYTSLLHIATTDHKTKKERKLTIDNLASALARRPWNADLKTLCWKLGESFVKVKGNDSDVYGKLYEQRKVYEHRINTEGGYAELAASILASKNYRGETIAKKAYEAGKLPDGHIHARAKRWAVKVFLSHWQDVAYRAHYNEAPPAPFAIAILGHAHKIPVPHREVA